MLIVGSQRTVRFDDVQRDSGQGAIKCEENNNDGFWKPLMHNSIKFSQQIIRNVSYLSFTHVYLI